MKIYTKTGDKGETSLRLGERIAKDHVRVEAYGSIDEANAFIGLALAQLKKIEGRPAALTELQEHLTVIQRELFDLGGALAMPPTKEDKKGLKVTAEQIERMEHTIDLLDAELPALQRFILPGGTEAAATLQVARAVCRRAERRMITLAHQEPVEEILIQYVNRLSDLLFIAGRYANFVQGVSDPEVVW